MQRSEQRWPAWPDDQSSYVPDWQVYQVAFDKPGNTRVTVVWNGDGSSTCIRIRRNGSTARAIDKRGAPVDVQRHADSWQLTLAAASAHSDMDPVAYYFIGAIPCC